MSLLDEMMNETKDAAPKGSLLDEVREQAEIQARAWMPAKSDFDGPKGIEGTVVTRTSVTSDHKDVNTGQFPQIPVLVIKDAKGENWSVKAYHKILRDEIEQANPQRGDLFAAIYRGQREPKKKGQQGAHVYKVGVRKASNDSGPGF